MKKYKYVTSILKSGHCDLNIIVISKVMASTYYLCSENITYLDPYITSTSNQPGNWEWPVKCHGEQGLRYCLIVFLMLTFPFHT